MTTPSAASGGDDSNNESIEMMSGHQQCPFKICRRKDIIAVKAKMIFFCCLFLMMLNKISLAQAQEIGVDICACSPSTYEFMFDFSLACPRPGGDYGPGIAEVTCFVTSFSENVEDLTPVSMQTISIVEADVDRIPIAQSSIEGDFENGSTFTYSSIAALGNATLIPESIQLTMTGLNEQDDSLVQVMAIKFTNDCDAYPVLEVGDTFGWVELVSDLFLRWFHLHESNSLSYCLAMPLFTHVLCLFATIF